MDFKSSSSCSCLGPSAPSKLHYPIFFPCSEILGDEATLLPQTFCLAAPPSSRAGDRLDPGYAGHASTNVASCRVFLSPAPSWIFCSLIGCRSSSARDALGGRSLSQMRPPVIGQDDSETTARTRAAAGRVRRGADKEQKEGFGRVGVETC